MKNEPVNIDNVQYLIRYKAGDTYVYVYEEIASSVMGSRYFITAKDKEEVAEKLANGDYTVAHEVLQKPNRIS